MAETSATYEGDVVAWAQEQARLLRSHRFDALDVQHLAEEIEDVGKSEQRELASRMAMLLVHLLKWQIRPERRGTSWEATIRHQRSRIARRLERTPSLKASLSDPDWWDDAWGDARLETARETGIGFDTLPADCPGPRPRSSTRGTGPTLAERVDRAGARPTPRERTQVLPGSTWPRLRSGVPGRPPLVPGPGRPDNLGAASGRRAALALIDNDRSPPPGAGEHTHD